eukprot:7278488-Prymnesium_polylepis.1
MRPRPFAALSSPLASRKPLVLLEPSLRVVVVARYRWSSSDSALRTITRPGASVSTWERAPPSGVSPAVIRPT